MNAYISRVGRFYGLTVAFLIGAMMLVGCSVATPRYRIPSVGIAEQTYDIEGKILWTNAIVVDPWMSWGTDIYRVIVGTADGGRKLITFTVFEPVTPVPPSHAERLIGRGDVVKIRVVKINGKFYGIEIFPDGLTPVEVKTPSSNEPTKKQ